VSDREPHDRLRRPSGVMPNATDPAGHAGHDLLVVVSGTDPAATLTERAAAERQIAACGDCALVASDLRSIASGLASLPRTIARPAGRDFRITREQARELRSGGRLRAWLRPFGDGGFQGIRPLAAAFTSLGVAGLLVAVLLPGIGGLGIGSQSQTLANGAGASVAELAPKDASGSPSAAFNSSSFAPGDIAGPTASIDFAFRSSSAPAPQVATDNSTPTGTAVGSPSPLIALSLALLAIGVVLFGLRLAAHRLR
jgi:hypothetical protein